MYTPEYREMLRTDRDDAARARAFDEWRARQSPEIKAACKHKLNILKAKGDMGDQQAKSLLGCLLGFVFMKIDEQDKWRAHGEMVQRAFEWHCAKKGIRAEVEVSG